MSAHRSPYVGHGADGCRRSADIDRSEADTYPTGSPDWQRCIDSADRWDTQAADVGEDSGLITASGEVECTECGHVIERHVGDGCPLCDCRVRWTAAEVADYRRRLGLPGTRRR